MTIYSKLLLSANLMISPLLYPAFAEEAPPPPPPPPPAMSDMGSGGGNCSSFAEVKKRMEFLKKNPKLLTEANSTELASFAMGKSSTLAGKEFSTSGKEEPETKKERPKFVHKTQPGQMSQGGMDELREKLRKRGMPD